MTKIIGVRFRRAGKIYYFSPDKYEFAVGDHAIVETVRGVEFGTVAIPPREVSDENIVKPLKSVIRKATAADIEQVEANRAKEKEAAATAREKIAKHGLEMKLTDVEFTFDAGKIIFYFTADSRVDFRELVKDLASVFRTRIELRQIGVRDESKMLGGLGPCGRPACCASFLNDFSAVSIKMAKEQSLSLSPTKISGLCGRLMCCLGYEQEGYEYARRQLPKVGQQVTTPAGSGAVAEIDVLPMRVKVRVTEKDGTINLHDFHVSEVSFKKRESGGKNDGPVIDRGDGEPKKQREKKAQPAVDKTDATELIEEILDKIPEDVDI